MKKIILCFLFSLFLSCSNDAFKEINIKDIDEALILNSSPTFKGYWYLGSDIAFHYFTSKWDYSSDNNFKVNKEGLKIIGEYPYGEREIHFSVAKPSHFETDIFFKVNGKSFYRKKIHH